MAGTALILFAHGSRDPEWAAPFRAVEKSLAEKRPDLPVRLAFLEIMEPTLPAAAAALAASGHHHIVIAPLFMGQGAHLKRDLAVLIDAVRRDHAGVKVELLPAAGEAAPVVNALSDWLVASVGS